MPIEDRFQSSTLEASGVVGVRSAMIAKGMTTGSDLALAATLAVAPRSGAPPFDEGEFVCDRWAIERLLGEGTFGWVFAAVAADERVALKVLRPEHALDDSIFVRFKRRELEILNRIHAGSWAPNVVRALDVTTPVHRGFVFIVLEYIDGPTLTDVIAKERVLDPGEAKTIALGIARGLAAIHAAGGIHRDLKPDNIRLRGGIQPVILDLGIAKAMWETQTLTGTNQTMMTPFYAAPEQLAGGELGPPCDVYALGLILYEMLVGSVPLAGRTFAETLAARSSRTPPDPRAFGRPLSDALATVTLRCLERDPADRPTALEVIDELGKTEVRRRQSGQARRVLGIFGALCAAGAIAIVVSRVGSGSPASHSLRESASVMTAPTVSSSTVAAAAKAVTISIDLPKKRFAHGEHLRLRLASKERVYVVLVSVAEDGTGTVLLPRNDRPAPRIEADRAIDFPSDDEQKVNLNLVAALPKMETSARERLVAYGIERRDEFDRLIGDAAKVSKSWLTLSRDELRDLDKRAASLGGAHGRVEASYDIGRPP